MTVSTSVLNCGGVLEAEFGGLFEGAEDDFVEADVDVDFVRGWGEAAWRGVRR